MAIGYLLDTSWVVGYLRGNPEVVNRLKVLHPEGLGVSMITVAELEMGVSLARDPQSARAGLEGFLAGIAILNLSQPICRLFAEWSVRLQQSGQKLEHFDVLIAATALHHRLVLCTFNRRHFERIEGLLLHQPLLSG